MNGSYYVCVSGSHFVCLFLEAIEAKLARRLTDETIRDAVKMWFNPATRQAAVDKYGEIGDWDVSRVTDMSGLFEGQKDFNENISRWDTSTVIDMSGMFSGASSFNQPLEGWNTSNVTDMSGMFYEASSFNQPVEGWNTANATDMRGVFDGASTFAQHPSWLH